MIMRQKATAPEDKRLGRIAHGAGAAVGAFLVSTLVIAVAIVVTGGPEVGEIAQTGQGVGFVEATATAAYGLAATIVSMSVSLLTMVTATGAAIIGLAVGAIGIIGAVVVGVGVVTGPVLLAIAIGVFIKRRFYPDVI